MPHEIKGNPFNPLKGLAGIEIGRTPDLGQVYFETWKNPNIGRGEVTAIESFWGKPTDCRVFTQRYGIQNQGFQLLFEYPETTTIEQAESQEIRVASTLLNLLVKRSGIRPEEIACFSLACSSPIFSKQYANIIAEEAGLKINDKFILETFAGCASSAIALERLFELYRQYPELSGQAAILLGLEGGRRFILGHKDPREVADEFALSILGLGAGGIIFRLGIDLIRITGIVDTFADTKAGITGQTSYIFDPDGDILQKQGNTWCIKIMPSPIGRKIAMEEGIIIKAVGKFVGNNIIRPLVSDHQTFIKQGLIEDAPIDFFASHHPSLLFKLHVAKQGGILETIPDPFVIREGNLSAASMPVALGRLIGNVKPGGYFGTLTYGGGFGAGGTIMQGGRRIW